MFSLLGLAGQKLFPRREVLCADILLGEYSVPNNQKNKYRKL
jgi:hypothetical protein